MWSMFSPLSSCAALSPPPAPAPPSTVPGIVVESFASPPPAGRVPVADPLPAAAGLRSGGARIGMAAVGRRPYVIPPAGWYRAVGGGGPPGPPVGGPTCGGGGPPGTACGTTPTAGAYPVGKPVAYPAGPAYWPGLTPGGAAAFGGGPSVGTKFMGGGCAPPVGRGRLGRWRSLRGVRWRCVLGLLWRRCLSGLRWLLRLLLLLDAGRCRGDVLARRWSSGTGTCSGVVEGRRRLVVLHSGRVRTGTGRRYSARCLRWGRLLLRLQRHRAPALLLCIIGAAVLPPPPPPPVATPDPTPEPDIGPVPAERRTSDDFVRTPPPSAAAPECLRCSRSPFWPAPTPSRLLRPRTCDDLTFPLAPASSGNSSGRGTFLCRWWCSTFDDFWYASSSSQLRVYRFGPRAYLLFLRAFGGPSSLRISYPYANTSSARDFGACSLSSKRSCVHRSADACHFLAPPFAPLAPLPPFSEPRRSPPYSAGEVRPPPPPPPPPPPLPGPPPPPWCESSSPWRPSSLRFERWSSPSSPESSRSSSAVRSSCS
uniref:Uncharacterized protein n=1 Tax=Anopheles dirus TaxID=7168 RepID=A0A182NPK1_9DIPT